MEKKKSNLSFSDQPLATKIVYTLVIVSLLASAVVIGIVAANDRNNTAPENPGTVILDVPTDENESPENPPEEQENKQETLTFRAPCVGTILTEHNLSVPVFSDTLGEWRVHSGIDIATEEGATVTVTAPGVVTAIYDDPLMGRTVEVRHGNGVISIYSNLAEEVAAGVCVGKVMAEGAAVGTVGDTAIKELAEEPHLHFGMKIGDAAVNPLDYFSLGGGQKTENKALSA